jgi:hypothetical protein
MGKGLAELLLVALTTGAPLCFAQGSDHPGKITDDAAIVAAFNGHHQVSYVEGAGLIVTQLLPDDTSGLPHQKWLARLSDGNIITIVYNTDEGQRVPIQVGDSFGVGGEYVPTGHTGLMHWLHDDPQKRRPDGYVYFNGVVYGDSDHEDN